jgi:hypothetical protein
LIHGNKRNSISDNEERAACGPTGETQGKEHPSVFFIAFSRGGKGFGAAGAGSGIFCISAHRQCGSLPFAPYSDMDLRHKFFALKSCSLNFSVSCRQKIWVGAEHMWGVACLFENVESGVDLERISSVDSFAPCIDPYRTFNFPTTPYHIENLRL